MTKYRFDLHRLAARCREGVAFSNTTHSSLLPGISKTLPLTDLLYTRLLKFVYRCLSSRSFIVNYIARHSILFCRTNSIVGRNVLSSCQHNSTDIFSVITYTASILRTLIVLCQMTSAIAWRCWMNYFNVEMVCFACLTTQSAAMMLNN